MADKKTILVTGGLGYIGSHTVVQLIAQNFDVVIIDNLANSTIEVLDRIEKITGIRPVFHKVDLTDFAATEGVFAKHSIDAVIHFAAYLFVNESVENPLKYYENNLFGLVNLIKASRTKNVNDIIFSSSCTVYGETDKLPMKEDTPVQAAMSPYGNTKQIGEEILYDSAKAYGLNVISLRYFNPIGAHPTALLGEIPHGVPTHIVPYITQTAMGIRAELSIFGNDYNTPDGTCVRDYIDVNDLADAHIAALNRLLKNSETNAVYEVYNIGTGKGVSVTEIIVAFERAANVKINYRYAPRRAGDVTAAYADSSLAKEKLGWEAKTSLEDTLRSAWQWELAQQAENAKK